MTLPTSPRAALVAAALCALAAAAVAADKAKPAAKPDAIMTPAQLKDCLDKQQRRDKATDAALKTKGEINAEKAAIDKSGTELSDAATTLDKTSEDAVNAFNDKVDERNKQIEAYEAKVAAYNRDAEGVRALGDEYAKSCANRRYDDRDLADIQRKK
ncbi:MAG TPA: hypothetical protein VFF43_01265 [Caldimonas sp.]|nr:hypothetical protein [Caldimonas sp.]